MSAPCPEFGFVLTVATATTMPREQIDALAIDLTDFLEPNGLVAGRRGDRSLEFVINREGSQATHADRQIVADWTRRWANVATFTISDLIDLNQSDE